MLYHAQETAVSNSLPNLPILCQVVCLKWKRFTEDLFTYTTRTCYMLVRTDSDEIQR